MPSFLTGKVIVGGDPVDFFRTDTTGLLNALDAARTWGVRRFAVASSLGVYIGRTEIPWHEDLALPTTDLPHLIVAFKKAVEPLTTHSLQGTGVQPVVLRIGSTWGPLMDPESPFNYIPPYISAGLRRRRGGRRLRRVALRQPSLKEQPPDVRRSVDGTRSPTPRPSSVGRAAHRPEPLRL